MKIFLPPLDSRWRLAADWTPRPEWLNARNNEETIWGLSATIDQWKKATGDTPKDGGDWVNRLHAWEVKFKAERGTPQFLKGTIIQIERCHVSRGGEDVITIKVLISPDPLLTPKKHGGKMRGVGRLYLSLRDMNSLPELEEVTEALT